MPLRDVRGIIQRLSSSFFISLFQGDIFHHHL